MLSGKHIVSLLQTIAPRLPAVLCRIQTMLNFNLMTRRRFGCIELGKNLRALRSSRADLGSERV